MPPTRSARLAPALLAVAALTLPARAQGPTLTLGQPGSVTLSGTARLKEIGTKAGGTYTYDDAGGGTPLAGQTFYNAWYAYGPSAADLRAGNVTNFYANDTSTASITGAFIVNLFTSGASTADVRGGTVLDIYTHDTSTVSVRGGSIDYLDTEGASVLDLFGTGLSETFVAQGSDFKQYTVTGTLQNGNLLNADYYDYSGTLEFNGVAAVPSVPEASSVASLGVLLVLGLGGLAAARRRKAPVESV